MSIRSIAVIICFAFITGARASSGPTTEQLANADYGQYPSEYMKMFRSNVVSAPVKCWVYVSAASPPYYLFGYMVDVQTETKKKVLRTESEPVDTPTGTILKERHVWEEETALDSKRYFIRNGKVYQNYGIPHRVE